MQYDTPTHNISASHIALKRSNIQSCTKVKDHDELYTFVEAIEKYFTNIPEILGM